MKLHDISLPDIRARIERDNPWWTGGSAAVEEANYPTRVYFESFCSLALNYGVKRAAILLGPRRVGKTVMLKQLVAKAISNGFPAQNILYVSIDTPIYSNIPLEQYLSHLSKPTNGEQFLVVFDEIQYLRDWQVHLKDLVDNYPRVKFVVSGSAAAALSLQSKESGAGRFSDFMLPPLTFAEFIQFSGREHLIAEPQDTRMYGSTDIEALNLAFVDYLNFGGYPEAVFNDYVRSNPDQFIRTDIIEKVLLKDLPSLYGITNIQELNKLFMMLAYNAGHEASYENISQASGISKPLIKKYIEYLESAFLIIKVSRVQENCRSMQRERTFKVYLNNPSMRSALISPVSPKDNDLIGYLAESAVFSQWQHSPNSRQLRYARWDRGEVDVIYLDNATEKPKWVGEVKWSDRYAANREFELRHIRSLITKHKGIGAAVFTTRTLSDQHVINGVSVLVTPTALYCYTVGKNVTSDLSLLRRVGGILDNDDEQESDLETA